MSFPKVLQGCPRNTLEKDNRYHLQHTAAYCHDYNGCGGAEELKRVLSRIEEELLTLLGKRYVYEISPLSKLYSKEERQWRIKATTNEDGRMVYSPIPLYVLYGLNIDGTLPKESSDTDEETLLQKLQDETRWNAFGNFGLVYRASDGTEHDLTVGEFIAHPLMLAEGVLNRKIFTYHMDEDMRKKTFKILHESISGRIRKIRRTWNDGNVSQHNKALSENLRNLTMDKIPNEGFFSFSPYAMDLTPTPTCNILQAIGVPNTDRSGNYGVKFFKQMLNHICDSVNVTIKPFMGKNRVTLRFPKPHDDDKFSVAIIARDFLYWHRKLDVAGGPVVHFETIAHIEWMRNNK